MGYTALDTAFKEAIGEFTIAFSQMEFALSQLSALTVIQHSEFNLLANIKLSLSKKRKEITKCVKSDAIQLYSIWEDLNQRIGKMNEERRYLMHGIAQYSLSDKTIEVFVPTKNNLNVKHLIPEDIKEFNQKIYHLTTGVDGVNGEFYNKFKTARINKWNEKLSDEKKMIYKVNNEVLTVWKGKI
jgi:Txe/YoeB family toxin of Txe-Axe toxin-antitoxin module